MTPLLTVSYFPGCSLSTSARESNQSLVRACEFMGLELKELEDWNCCGTSSAHALDPETALGLCARILTLAPPDRPLMVMCPSCHKNLAHAIKVLRHDDTLRRRMERQWGGEISPKLQVVTFLELLHFLERIRNMTGVPHPEQVRDLKGLKVAPYYGCMGMFPPTIRPRVGEPVYMARQLKALGADVLNWMHANRCCGTFLAAARPDVSTPLVNEIMASALASGAQVIVTACAMCQMNLEIRCSIRTNIPTLHFSELLALVLGADDYPGWFNHHLVDPRPVLSEAGLIEGPKGWAAGQY
jgi:heterodisulfide reductase subunit B